MRLRAKKDLNHNATSDGLRKLGYSVLDLSRLGDGCPDVAVGWDFGAGDRGAAMIEIKKPGPPSARKLTDDQEDFRKSWTGPYFVVQSWEEAAAELLILRRGW